ncbi:hypothetical protein DFH94DRAFT_700719 [Russula ochroleuca]|jgi:hypothetical protein|uniref:Uncharacterized protein n=1 Tax=Russula ochroleuca TaxID=152965 RepID=A0A9P5TDK1_9AGAM|nr:hypothetical protein DFH94DRAFT_700719 [Russula ochroleuca]
MDPGATRTMCSHRAWFSFFTLLASLPVKAATTRSIRVPKSETAHNAITELDAFPSEGDENPYNAPNAPVARSAASKAYGSPGNGDHRMPHTHHVMRTLHKGEANARGNP